MRWWVRLILTLLLTPILWRLATVYLANQMGEPLNDLASASPAALGSLILVFTLPALALVLFVLTPAEVLIKKLGLDLAIVAVAPLLAIAVALAIAAFIHDTRLPQGLPALFFVYGLVWGLCIREPRAPRRQTIIA